MKTSPQPLPSSVKSLHIHVDMVSTQYLTPGSHHTDRIQSDALRDSSSSSGHSTGAYTTPELDPYSAVRLDEAAHRFISSFLGYSDSPHRQASGVSSFNYPAAADSTLLTPVSSTGSPPLQQRQAAKNMRSYRHSHTAAAGAQGPTPPNTSKMYYRSYEMNSSSQGSSPMTVNPHITEAPHFDMAPYMAHSPPGSHHHHPPSPKTEVPPPIDPYLGHFTVSGGNDAEVAHHPFNDYNQFASANLDPTAGFMVRQQAPQHIPVSMHHRIPSNGTQAPILVQPHPAQFRPQTSSRIGGIEDLRDPGMLLGAYPPQASLSPGRRAAHPQSARKKSTATSRKPSRTPKTPNAGSAKGQSSGGNGVDEEDRDELTLRDDAPDDDKYLFELRKEFISEKGKGMWEEMKAKYSEKHQGNWEKAALQMKVSRAVAKFGVWPKREIERLREAHQYYEEKRYQLILARMKENGGCRVWDWKPQHIEAMLVKLGMEEPMVDEKMGTRRRKNKAARRRASHNSQLHHHQQHAANVMNDWSNGLGLHPSFHGHPHHVAAAAAARQASFELLSDEASSIAPTFTSEQENEYLDQIFSKQQQQQVKSESSLSPEIMELAYHEDDGRPTSRDFDQHPQQHHHNQHSERVARQACEQMMQQHQGRGHGHSYPQ
ncbi:hypothetical protein B0T25DRAFT_465074 [Lasiosphaeria hispida]|uniref:Uncharacterized protein n=1 Tax=Lasiosphaeria hispida TaxID=260671 RepID=A0AAJ0M851_9PEZI|nr:hypothetical protein B0T25DRAFT_465074 [Lasiosphaeria hispida]